MSGFAPATTIREEKMAIPDHGDDLHGCMSPEDIIMNEMISVKSKGPGKRIDIYNDLSLASTLPRKQEPGPDLPLQDEKPQSQQNAAPFLYSASNCETSSPGTHSTGAPSSSDQAFQEEFTSNLNIKSIPLSCSRQQFCLPPRKRRIDSPARKPIGSPRKSIGKETGLALVDKKNPYPDQYLIQNLLKWSREGVVLKGQKFRVRLEPFEVRDTGGYRSDVLNSGMLDRPPDNENNILPTANPENMAPIYEDSNEPNLPTVASSLEYSRCNQLKNEDGAEKNAEPLDLSCGVRTGNGSFVSKPLVSDVYDQDAPLDYSYKTLKADVPVNMSQMGPTQFVSNLNDGPSGYRERPSSASSVDQQLPVNFGTDTSMEVDEAKHDGLPSLEQKMSESLRLGSDSLMNSHNNLNCVGSSNVDNSLPTPPSVTITRNLVAAIMSLPDDKARQFLACMGKPVSSNTSPKPQVSSTTFQTRSVSKDECFRTTECTSSSAVPDLFGLQVASEDGSFMQTSSEKIKDKLKLKLESKMEPK